MFAQNIPATAFLSTAIDEDFAPQSALCVAFTSPPREMGPVKAATFSDTVGNLNQLYEVVAK